MSRIAEIRYNVDKKHYKDEKKRKSISDSKLAEVLNWGSYTDKSNMSNLIKKGLTENELTEMCNYFGCTPDYLMGKSTKREKTELEEQLTNEEYKDYQNCRRFCLSLGYRIEPYIALENKAVSNPDKLFLHDKKKFISYRIYKDEILLAIFTHDEFIKKMSLLRDNALKLLESFISDNQKIRNIHKEYIDTINIIQSTRKHTVKKDAD